jgi:hypothetical protein
MPERRRPRGWAFFALITLLAALPLAASYFWLRSEVKAQMLSQHRRQINNQLNQWQEQLYDAKWDSLADTADDVLHLGSYDEAQLMADTLAWYVYPDGHAFIEGTAVVGLAGQPRPSKIAAVIDNAGEPLEPARLAGLKKAMPWLENPWLPNYSFVIKAFQKEPQREFYISPLLRAPGRLVYVLAAPWRTPDGKLKGAVIQQQAITQFFDDIIAPSAKGVSLWLMDNRGTVGVATDQLARNSAAGFKASGALAQAVAQGYAAAEDGSFGARGSQVQELPQGPAHLYWRTMEDRFVLAVVESEASLGAVGRTILNKFGAIALVCLVLLAAAGGAFTLASLRREGRMVEKDTLRRYAGTMSHRVRNDLVVLSGAHEMMQKAGGGELDENHVETLGKAIADIGDTVRELERLSLGEEELLYEGQLGDKSMYRLNPEGGKGGRS